jgi:hypothetical protein
VWNLTEDKLCEDFKSFNLEIEWVTKQEIMKVRQEIDALKAKAAKVSEKL